MDMSSVTTLIALFTSNHLTYLTHLTHSTYLTHLTHLTG
jgi:hypothetical protein